MTVTPFWGWDRQHRYELEMVAAIVERGDDQVRDGWCGGEYTDANWVIDILLGQLGKKIRVDEDGNVSIWPKDDGEDNEPILPNHYPPSTGRNLK
jgi:hypothetical protein